MCRDCGEIRSSLWVSLELNSLRAKVPSGCASSCHVPQPSPWDVVDTQDKVDSGSTQILMFTLSAWLDVMLQV